MKKKKANIKVSRSYKKINKTDKNNHFKRIIDNRKELLEFIEISLDNRFDFIVNNISKIKDNNFKKKLISGLGELKSDVFYFWLIKNWKFKDFDKIAKDKFCIKHILK